MGSRRLHTRRDVQRAFVLIGVGASLALAACDRDPPPPPAAPSLPTTVELPSTPPPPAPTLAPPEPEAPAPAPSGGITPPVSPPKPVDPAYVLTCDGPFGPTTSLADLRSRFGAANVVEEAILGPEASELDGAVLFPEDPARRIEIVWIDVGAKRGVASALVYDDDTVWTGPGGLRIGAELPDVEAINGGAFILYGFEWDFGGVVADWLDGGLYRETAGGACNVQVRFGVVDTVDPDLAIAVAGDAEFTSDDPRMLEVRPVVRQLGIGFAHGG